MTGEPLVPYLEPQWSLIATLALIGGSMLYSWSRTRSPRGEPTP
jgi:tellurite resistance protein TerC